MIWRVQSSSLTGAATVPGDKSIAHRALMLAGLARGTSVIRNVPAGEDVLSTAACMSRLGVAVDIAEGTARMQSDDGISAPIQELDAGNSGTTIRLLTGILSGQSFSSRLTGDASLRRRPMGRVVGPLRQMGASIETHDGSAPLDITGAARHGIEHTLPVASAQRTSGLLPVGLVASG